MSKYYEITKSNYSRDINHLITFNNNGLWIKENVEGKQRIINASKLKEQFNRCINSSFDQKFKFNRENNFEKANIISNEWIFKGCNFF